MEITKIKGVGPKTSENLKKIGIATVYDAVNYFPRDYEDRSITKPIDSIVDGDMVSLEVNVERVMPSRRTGSGKTITRIVFSNSTGKIIGIWFNQPYMTNNFKHGEKVFLYGKASKKDGEKETCLVDPSYEKDFDANSYGINPIYPINKSLTQKIMRKTIRQCLTLMDQEMEEIFSESFMKIFSLLDRKSAMQNVHFPASQQMLASSKERLKFEELLMLQLCLLMARKSFLEQKTATSISIHWRTNEFIEKLPFKLTKAQDRTVSEILGDMEKSCPMNRLVQGDVGSGKTAVAFIGLVNAALSGYQAAMMAPTEILAEQHHIALGQLAADFGIKTALLKGSMPAKEKNRVLEEIANGEVSIVIGTHALIQDKVVFRNLAFVVTDEQHRFGVRQRAALICKGNNPHVLVMTATPIPRTLALFIYGDMDISIIDELPPGRQKIDTFFVDPSKKDRLYHFVKNELDNGRQAYVVCPLVEESEKVESEAAVETRELLKYKYFEEYHVGLLHGRMSAKEKDEVMNDFKNGKTNVLVSTTVVEVGVNVPNATVMVIENADRFGLAQLHQLRGRVGRGQHKSYCIMISGVNSRELRERMKIMVQTNDGFQIADKDLELRGSGEFFGFRQHGLPELKMADIVYDLELVKKTRDIARELVDSGDIHQSEHIKLKSAVDAFFKDKIELVNFN